MPGKRWGNRRNGHAATTAVVQPKLHENMDEVDLHDESHVVVDNSPKIKSAKFVPLSLVMNGGGVDPPDDSDSDSSAHECSDDAAANYRRPVAW